MSPVVEQILQQIDELSPREQAQILQHLNEQAKNITREVSKLNRFTELLQAEGCYEDANIQQNMTSLADRQIVR